MKSKERVRTSIFPEHARKGIALIDPRKEVFFSRYPLSNSRSADFKTSTWSFSQSPWELTTDQHYQVESVIKSKWVTIKNLTWPKLAQEQDRCTFATLHILIMSLIFKQELCNHY